MSTASKEMLGHLAPLLSQVSLEGSGQGGGVLVGPPHALAEICRCLGFRNACARGRVYITGAKLAWIGLIGARVAT